METNEKGQRTFSGWWTGNAALAAQHRFCPDGDKEGEYVLSAALYTDKSSLSADSRQWCMSVLIEDLKVGCTGLEICARFGAFNTMSARDGVGTHVLGRI